MCYYGEQRRSQGLQSHVGRREACLPAPLPASLGHHRRPSCTRLLCTFSWLYWNLPGHRRGALYTVSHCWEVRGSCRTIMGSTSLWLINNWPWSSKQSDRGGDNGSLCCPIHQCWWCQEIPVCHTERVCTQQCPAGTLPWLSRMTNSRVQCPHGELKTTVN